MRREIDLIEGILAKTNAEKSAVKMDRIRRFRKGERKKVARDHKGGSAYKHPTPEQKKKKMYGEDDWDVDLCMYLFAKVYEQCGEIIEGLIYTREIAKEQGDMVGIFFKPPMNIRKIGQEEFPDAEKLWWEAVTEMLKSGKAFDMTDPDKIKPLFGKVTSIWKNKVEAQYGYRPSRGQERSLQQDIDKGIKDAARAMRASRSKDGVSREALSRAARALRARRTVRMKAA